MTELQQFLNEGEAPPRRFPKAGSSIPRNRDVNADATMHPAKSFSCSHVIETSKAERVGTNDFKLRLRLSRPEMPVDAAGHWRRVGGKLADEIDHLGALRRREPHEGFQKPQALDRFAGWVSKLLAQF